MQRRLMLTAELVARVQPWSEGDSVGPMPDGARPATESDHDAIVNGLLSDAPDGDIWVFAYGSLIWNPACDHVERIGATARGWHRAFCLGWGLWFRGSPSRPGLMLALDRGGSCKGIAFRLPAQRAEQGLHALSRREVHVIPHPFPPRWINIETAQGRLRAITFAMNRQTDQYLGRRPLEEVADVLATAAGRAGSMAEYLHQTVSRLDELGLHDGQLWRLQEMVAARLEAPSIRT